MASLIQAVRKNKIAIIIILAFIGILYYLGTARKPLIIKEEDSKGPDIPDEDRLQGINPTCKERLISSKEILVHNKCSLMDVDKNDAWIVINGYVYNITEWIEFHPGGDSICAGIGIDATEYFNLNHGEDVIKEYLPSFCIGKVSDPENIKST